MSKRSIRFLDHQQQSHTIRRPDCLALSKDETILLSSCGDVVACRCRDSAHPHSVVDKHQHHNTHNWNGYYWDVAEQVAATCCETNCDDLSNQLREAAFCGSTWNLGDDFSSPGGSAGGGGGGIQQQPPPEQQRHTPLPFRQGGGGLLGGNPADVATPFLRHPEPAPNHMGLQGGGGGYFHDVVDPTFQEKAAVAFRSPPLRNVVNDNAGAAAAAAADDDLSSIVPIRSFDYSHFFADNGNDMLPETPRRSKSRTTTPRARESSPPDDVLVSYSSKEEKFFHGIPTFLKAFTAVRITQCSAHPLGSHVLLISAAGLLYSYGLNDSGQLGIGIQTRVSGFHRGYICNPTIVTPLLENGGKAIACAAGVNHSLVVVETEERRIVKSRSFDPPSTTSSSSHNNHGGTTATAATPLTTASSRSVDDNHPPTNRLSNASSTETVVYHQIYGFGRNDSMKIGLISPRVALINGMEEQFEAVLLPRRVALQCRVHQYDNHNHNEAPRRRSSSSAAAHAAAPSRPPLGIFDVQASAEHSSALVHRSSGDIELYTWGNATFGALGCSMPSPAVRSPSSSSVVPVNVVPVPSFVASLSQSSNEEAQASSLLMDGEYPLSVSLARRCSFVTTSLGRCFSFGSSDEGMLGLGPKVTEAHWPSEVALPIEVRNEGLIQVRAGASHVVACTDRGRVLAWGAKGPSGLSFSKDSIEHHHHHHHHQINGQPPHKSDPAIQWSPHPVEITGKAFRKQHDCQVVQVGAGYDCSIFVTESGRVLSCGRPSGRLGLGDVRTEPSSYMVVPPQPLLGGLRLWHDDRDARRKRPGLKRGVTIS